MAMKKAAEWAKGRAVFYHPFDWVSYYINLLYK